MQAMEMIRVKRSFVSTITSRLTFTVVEFFELLLESISWKKDEMSRSIGGEAWEEQADAAAAAAV